MVKYDSVGDDQIERRLARRIGQGRLTLAVADHLAAAERHFFAVDREVLFDSIINSVSARRMRSPVVGP